MDTEKDTMIDNQYTSLLTPGGRASARQAKSPLKKAGRIVRNLAFLVFLSTMSLLVFSLVQSRLSGGPPSIAGHQMYMVLSGSMKPAFDTGSLAFLRQAEPGDIQVGDIITFRTSAASETLTTHRVVEVHSEGDQFAFTTRGDANEANDPFLVSGENVLGRIVYAIPYAGYLVNFSRQKTGLLLLVIIPGILIIIFELRNLLNLAAEWEKEREGKKNAGKLNVTGKSLTSSDL